MKRLKTMREFRELSQAELAHQLGVNVEQIRKWETGEEQPTDQQLISIASFFNCPVSTFRAGIQHERTGTQTQTVYSDQAIRCPHCGSRSLAFVHDYHKSLILRFLEIVLTIWIFIALLSNIPDILYYTLIDFSKSSAANIEKPIIATIIPVIFYYLIKLARYSIESRTHVKSICRDCGHIWLID